MALTLKPDPVSRTRWSTSPTRDAVPSGAFAWRTDPSLIVRTTNASGRPPVGPLSPKHIGSSTVAPLTATQLQVVLGSLLGDACLNVNGLSFRQSGDLLWNTGCPRLIFSQGGPQHEYCLHKAERLGDYVVTAPKQRKNLGYGGLITMVSTVSTPALDFLVPLCYRYDTVAGRFAKTVTSEWLELLDWEGVAYWLMDDGSNSAGAVTFHTEGFTFRECQLLTDWLTARGCDASTFTQTRRATGAVYTVVGLSREGTRVLVEKVRPWVLPMFSYKLETAAVMPEVACCICGKVTRAKNNQMAAEFVTCRNKECQVQTHMMVAHRHNEVTNRQRDPVTITREYLFGWLKEQLAFKNRTPEQVKEDRKAHRRAFRRQVKTSPKHQAALKAERKAYLERKIAKLKSTPGAYEAWRETINASRRALLARSRTSEKTTSTT